MLIHGNKSLINLYVWDNSGKVHHTLTCKVCYVDVSIFLPAFFRDPLLLMDFFSESLLINSSQMVIILTLDFG